MASDPTPTCAGRRRLVRGAVASGALVLLIAAGNAATVAVPARVASARGAATAQDPARLTSPSPATAPAPTPVASAPAAAGDAASLGVPAAHRVATPVARAPVANVRNRLVSADGSLNTGVGFYSDCSGRTELTHAMAAIETCIPGRTYFVGHNPGVFTPLLHMGVGSIITWYDGNGTAHRLRIIAVRTWHRFAGVPNLLAGATAEFQTCITADGTVDRLMDAAPA